MQWIYIKIANTCIRLLNWLNQCGCDWQSCNHSNHDLNTLRLRQNWRYLADDIFKCIFLNENTWISIKFWLMFVHKGSINNISSLVQIMTWRRPGDKPLSEPMMVRLLTHINQVSIPTWHSVWDARLINVSIFMNDESIDNVLFLRHLPYHHYAGLLETIEHIIHLPGILSNVCLRWCLFWPLYFMQNMGPYVISWPLSPLMMAKLSIVVLISNQVKVNRKCFLFSPLDDHTTYT